MFSYLRARGDNVRHSRLKSHSLISNYQFSFHTTAKTGSKVFREVNSQKWRNAAFRTLLFFKFYNKTKSFGRQ